MPDLYRLRRPQTTWQCPLTTRKDKKQLEDLEYQKARLKAEEDNKRAVQDQQSQSQRQIRATEEMKKARLLEKSLQKAEKRREDEGWITKAGKGVKASQAANLGKEQQNKPPAPSKPDLSEIRQQREQTRREREPDFRDRRSHGEQRRQEAERRQDPAKVESKGRSEQIQPKDIDAIKREAEQHLQHEDQQRQRRGEDSSEDYDI